MRVWGIEYVYMISCDELRIDLQRIYGGLESYVALHVSMQRGGGICGGLVCVCECENLEVDF